MISLYVHVPWCRTKCRYCAFYSLTCSPTSLHTWLVPSIPPLPFEALYIGGGTPSLLGSDGFAALCHSIRAQTNLSHLREWTVEANPDSLTPDFCRTLLNEGVTRLSLGAQSFHNPTLRFLGRPHDCATIHRAVQIARQAGFQHIGLDLIAGIPGVTRELWLNSLHHALDLQCEHLSVYALTLENDTPLANDVQSGITPLPSDDLVLDHLALAQSLLEADGFTRYEVSNYARPGHECLYNLSVWRGEDYIGIGPTASSRYGLLRRTNGPIGQPPELQTLSPQDDRRERFLTGLRLHEGFTPQRWLLPNEAQAAIATLNRLHPLGLVEPIPNTPRWRLSPRGLEVADSIALELL